MDKLQARDRIRAVFEQPFDKERFMVFIRNLLNRIDETKAFHVRGDVKESFRSVIKTYERIGSYEAPDGKKIDIIIAYLQKSYSIHHARVTQRNFAGKYLSDRGQKDAGLFAFVSPDDEDWRFSLVKMEYKFEQTPTGMMKVKEEFTPARRWSFLVGANERSHTAQSRLVNILAEDDKSPTLEQIEEAFNIETVTKEFFREYRDLFIRTKEALDKLIQHDPGIQADFKNKGVNTVDFSKKLMGQIIFLYFLQKKGWFGVARNSDWGTGSKKFLRELFESKHGTYGNFFNDILEPLFYDALSRDRSDIDHWNDHFKSKIPFLNGGLFDPIGNYNWYNTDILFPNDLFSNQKKTKDGDIGDGILDIFDRYNFTVKEDEPLEKEVAIDPELLGKAYEKFNAIRPDNFEDYKQALKSSKKGDETKFNKKFGVYYTPREIVHYMCQQSLINYLFTELSSCRASLEKIGDENLVLFDNKNKKGQLDFIVEHRETPVILKEDIEKLFHHGESVTENEVRVENKGKETSTYYYLLPESIRINAERIDKKLSEITVCDPAVGSGAFPVGMMNEIVRARTVLTTFIDQKTNRTTYDFNRRCIEHSLYGVDIDPGAVEIAKLRLWLSLIVDEDDIQNIKPLPNLDYKIVCGNSLVGFPDNWGSPIEKEIESFIHQHFNETNVAKKIELKARIDEKIGSRYKNSLMTFGYQVNFDFRTVFSEVFQKRGGFDVVIANPPYVGQKGNQELFSDMKNDKNFEKKMDYWYFFLHKAHYISSNNGLTTFITPNYWVTANGAKKLRNKIVNDFYFIEWMNFNENSIFNAGIHTNVFILRKNEAKNKLVQCIIYNNTYSDDLISHKNAEFNFVVDQNYLYQQWTGFVHFLPQENLHIVRRLIQDSLPLCDISTTGKSKEGITAGKHLTDGICNINQGLVTGKDRHKEDNRNEGVFVVNQTEYEKFSQSDRVRLMPFYKNSDIKRYFASQSPKYYLISVNDINSELEFKKKSSIYAHLSKYKSLLKKRSINGVLQSAYQKGKWWALTTDRPNIDFNSEKILCPQRSNINTFGYSDSEWYAASDVFYITLNKKEYSLKYILSILNSKLTYYWLYYMGKRKGDILELTLEPLQFVPIKNISHEKQAPYISLVDRILAAKRANPHADTSKWEWEIDRLVYQLYGLTEEEIKIIEGKDK